MTSRILVVVLVIAMMASPIYAQSSQPLLQSEVALDFTSTDRSSQIDREAVVSVMTVADALPDKPSASEEEVFRGYAYRSYCSERIPIGSITVDGEPYEWRLSGSEWLRYDTSAGSRNARELYSGEWSYDGHILIYLPNSTF